MKRDYEKQQSNIKLIETKFARSLRKLGIKQPYLIQGGFQFWVKQGLRFKELKSESTLTILKEAEAILEDINPSLVQALGYGVAIGLPTSPSFSAVQNRVLQAAAKHEFKPSDAEGLAPQCWGARR
ncbi:hypothetical protein CsatB_013148 [Cannabis sativa]